MRSIATMSTEEIRDEFNARTGGKVSRFSSRADGANRLERVRAEDEKKGKKQPVVKPAKKEPAAAPDIEVTALKSGDPFSRVPAAKKTALLKKVVPQKPHPEDLELDAETPASRSSSRSSGASIAASWTDPNVAAARKQRSAVAVARVTYRSVAEAFRALGLPMQKCIAFRMALKAAKNGVATFDVHEFKIVKQESLL